MQHYGISRSFVKLMLTCGFVSTVFLLGNSDTMIDSTNIELTTDSTQQITTTYTEPNTTTPLPDTSLESTTTQDSSAQATGENTMDHPSSAQSTQTDNNAIPQTGSNTQTQDMTGAVQQEAIQQTGAQEGTTTGGDVQVTGSTGSNADVISGGTHQVATGASADLSYAPKPIAFPGIDLLALLRHPNIQQYKPGNHIGALDEPGYIVYASSDLIPLAYEGLVAASFSDVSSGVQELFIGTDIFYRSYDNQIQIKLPEGLQIKTNDDKPFSTHELELEQITGADGIFTLQTYDRNTNSYTILEQKKIENDNKEQFHFGVSGEHLIFSKPLEVKIFSDAPNGTLVDIMANHANQGRTKDGLATDLSTECHAGSASIPGSITTVQNNIITFYICGASVFALTYTGGANSDNMADGGFKDKAVAFLTGTHFPTGATINTVVIGIDRRPIDGRDPSNPGVGSCAPGDVYFTLTHNTGGTSMILIASGQLTNPNSNCPRVYTTFSNLSPSPITGWYYTGGFAPTTGQTLGVFNGEAPFGSWILRMGDTSNNSDAVILYGFTITIDASTGQSSSGYVCIHSPSFTIGTAYTSTSTTGIYEIDIGSFELEDPAMPYTGYYTTLTVAPPVYKAQTGITLSTGNMERKATAVVQLTGTPNTTVRIDTGRLTYTGVQEPPRVFILRNDGVGAGRVGRWQSNLRIRITMPPYMKPGYWASQITYTLYSN